MLICWDQWYPEAARITSLLGAQVLFYPTAIGWHPDEQDEWGAAQVDAWRTAQRAHAIANGVYVAAPNRIGHEDEPGTKGITFFGRSFIADPFGRYLAEAGDRGRDPDRPLRPGAHRGRPPQLAIPARSPRRRLRADPQPVSRLVTPARPSLQVAACGCRPSGSRIAPPGSAGRITSPIGPASSDQSPGSTPRSSAPSPRTNRSRFFATTKTVLADARGRARGPRRSPPTACASTSSRPIASGFAIRRRSASIDSAGDVVLLSWAFNGWAKYDNWRARRARSADAIAAAAGRRSRSRGATDTGERIVLEGGGIDVNGHGLLLVTEEWLLSDMQVRNPGLTRGGLRGDFRRVAGRRPDDLARRRLRRRRHAWPRRRHRAVRQRRHDRAGGRERSRATTTTNGRSTTCVASSCRRHARRRPAPNRRRSRSRGPSP